MHYWSLFVFLGLYTLVESAAFERKTHRLIGGHLKIQQDDDSELLTTLESGSKNKKSQKSDDEEKKTLSQQVSDGKYGLIQKELFAKPLKRPGVLSYEANPEVPKDNINNLGGLTKNDIWLAENHLLVIKGGTYPPHSDKGDNNADPWPAIDDYKAPLRQVKIPSHPKVPPPFPVQLSDDGPLQILGTNSSRTLNGSYEQEKHPLSANAEEGEFFPNLYQYPANTSAGEAPGSLPPGEYLPGVPFPPSPLNGTLPPFFASLPPGAAILPPPNQTELLDEDDPSIYYPPPYSFFYPKDNSSLVPAGPLVPGIILPPPPNFFGRLEDTTPPARKRVKPTTQKPQLHHVHIPEINNELNPIVTVPPPKIVTVLPVRQYQNRTRTQTPVTILKPVQPPPAPPLYVYKPRVKTVITTTQIPLKVYYSTTNDVDTNSITEKYRGQNIRQKPTTKSPAKYYYYEDQASKPPPPRAPSYYDAPKEYYLPPKPTPPQKLIYVTSRPYTQRPRYRFVEAPKRDSFSVHIARLQKQIHQYYTTPRPAKPVYQFSFEASNYREQQNQEKFRPLPKYSVQIQPAIEIIPTTPRPPKSRPISQYSYEATPNPLYQGFYTKPDEPYFDDNTKQYFSSFGQKLPTTPLPPPPYLGSDTRVNYLPQRPAINPNAEYVPARSLNQQDGSFISYQLPGDDGAHFYFLTPQLAQSRDQGSGYYYSQPRVRRNKNR